MLNPLLRAGSSTTLKDNALIVSLLKNRRVLNDFTVEQKYSGRIFCFGRADGQSAFAELRSGWLTPTVTPAPPNAYCVIWPWKQVSSAK